MSPLEITLVILLVTIIAFVSGKVPFSVISTGIILALILTGIKTPAEAFGGFINTNVVMFVAMFVIGAGLTKTPLIDKAQSLVIRYKDNMRMLIFLSCVAGAFLGAITSATATAAIMIPLLVGIANDIGVSRSKLLYLFVKKFPAGVQKVLDILFKVIIAAFLCVLIYYGYGMTTTGWARQITSLHISYSWVTMAVPVGSFFMLISTILNIIERVKTPAGQEVKHEAGRDVG